MPCMYTGAESDLECEFGAVGSVGRPGEAAATRILPSHIDRGRAALTALVPGARVGTTLGTGPAIGSPVNFENMSRRRQPGTPCWTRCISTASRDLMSSEQYFMRQFGPAACRAREMPDGRCTTMYECNIYKS